MGPRLASALVGALEAIVEHADVGLLVHRSGTIVDANDWLGGSALAGKPVAAVFPELDVATTGMAVTRLADGRTAEVRTLAIEHEGAPAVLMIVRSSRGRPAEGAEEDAVIVRSSRGRPAEGAEEDAVIIRSSRGRPAEGAEEDAVIIRSSRGRPAEGAEEDAVIPRASREAVLREVHHRIKNDLQVICSLLSLQAQHVVDPAMRTAFAESQSRVHAIALVHDQLQRARDRGRVELGAYLQQLVEHLARSHAGIAVRVEVDAIEVPVDIATPCGLLVHELVTNALRHAFVGGRRGTVTLGLHERDRRVTIRVADDGVGLPPAITPETAQTLGLGLVATFVEQLDATLELVRDGGTAFAITFARTT